MAFLEVVDRTDRDWKAVAYAVGNILQCWEHEGTIDAVLDYDAYTDETTEEVVEIMRDLSSTSAQLTEYVIDDDQTVAVVGYDQLTDLERSILPTDHDRVDLFADEQFDLPPFHVFDSSADIIDVIMDTVTAENAGERRVKEFLDGLDGELHVEEPAVLPLDVDGERVSISGLVDLVHVTTGGVEIVDFKTDLSRRAEKEYRKQFSVYYHVLDGVFTDRKVTASIYYTANGELAVMSPLYLEELA